jgi:hypothetical protein
MKIVELIIDENEDMAGVDAISIVESPAIESNFVALGEQKDPYKFAKVDTEKRILMGGILIPNKTIYRRDLNGDEYYIYFSKETIRKAAELYFINANQSNTTYEHFESVTGCTLIESWFIEDESVDKSKLYNLGLPVGSWCGTMKINNDEIWNDYVKTGRVKGFSIEGYFADKFETKMSRNHIVEEILAGLDILEIIQNLYGKK